MEIKNIYDLMSTKNDYQLVFKAMRKFSLLPESERRIIEKLMNVSAFEGNMSDFNRNFMGLDEQVCSSTRKALVQLDKLGLVYVVRKYRFESNPRVNPMAACYLIDGWLNILVNKSDEQLKDHYFKQYKKGGIK